MNNNNLQEIDLDDSASVTNISMLSDSKPQNQDDLLIKYKKSEELISKLKTAFFK